MIIDSAATSRFMINLPHYRIDSLLIPQASTLVITFEPMGRLQELGAHRAGWGIDFLQGLGCAVLAVMVKDMDWYRQADLAAFFQHMRERGFFAGFKKIITYGGSMGGFAALAYADSVCATHVVAMNPQATLSAEWAAWETRFAYGKQQNWQTEPRTAVTGFQQVEAAYVVYDPLFSLDARHVRLLAENNPQLVTLKLPAVGHHIPKWLAEMDLLKPTLTAIIQGQFTALQFHQAARKRRNLKRYWSILREHPRIIKSARRLHIVNSTAPRYGC